MTAERESSPIDNVNKAIELVDAVFVLELETDERDLAVSHALDALHHLLDVLEGK